MCACWCAGAGRQAQGGRTCSLFRMSRSWLPGRMSDSRISSAWVWEIDKVVWVRSRTRVLKTCSHACPGEGVPPQRTSPAHACHTSPTHLEGGLVVAVRNLGGVQAVAQQALRAPQQLAAQRQDLRVRAGVGAGAYYARASGVGVWRWAWRGGAFVLGQTATAARAASTGRLPPRAPGSCRPRPPAPAPWRRAPAAAPRGG